MRKLLYTFMAPVFLVLLFQACNLDDFELDRLTDPTDLKPELFAPIASGNYSVKNFVSLSGNSSAAVPALVALTPISYDINGIQFSDAAVDSVTLLVTMNNQTPMELSYTITSTYLGLQMGKSYTSGVIAPGAKVTNEFGLSRTDMENIDLSTRLLISALLAVPSGGTVTEQQLLNSDFGIQVSLKGRFDLIKASN